MDNELLKELIKHYHNITPEDVVGVGFGKKTVGGKTTDEDAIVFTVKNKKPLSQIPEDEVLPSKIEVGDVLLPTDVEEGVYSFASLTNAEYCPNSFYSWDTVPPGNRDKIRPIQGGISVTNYTNMSNSRGTLGFLAVDNQTNSLVGVSNNHVLIPNAFLASEREPSGVQTNVTNNFVTQPNEGGNKGLQNSVGLVKRYVPLSGTGSNIGAPNYNTVDAALTTINESDISTTTSYRQYGMNGWTLPLEFASTAEIDGLFTNQNNLFSSGRTTGPKGEGESKLFTDLNSVSVSIEYNNQGVDEQIYFADCIRFGASASTTTTGYWCFYPIVGGDSGSALVADFSGTRKIVGIVFASLSITGRTQSGNIVWVPVRGLANRIDKVAEQLDISPWTGNTVNFSDTGNTKTHTVQGLSSDINLILSGNTYWQSGTKT